MNTHKDGETPARPALRMVVNNQEVPVAKKKQKPPAGMPKSGRTGDGNIKAPPAGGFNGWRERNGKPVTVPKPAPVQTKARLVTDVPDLSLARGEELEQLVDPDSAARHPFPPAPKAPDPGGCGLCIDGVILRRNPRFPSLAPIPERCACALGKGLMVAPVASPVVVDATVVTPALPEEPKAGAVGPAEELRLRMEHVRRVQGIGEDRINDRFARLLHKAGKLSRGDAKELRVRELTEPLRAWKRALGRKAIARCVNKACREFLALCDSDEPCPTCGADWDAYNDPTYHGGAKQSGYLGDLLIYAYQGTSEWLRWADELLADLLAGKMPPAPPLETDDEDEPETTPKQDRRDRIVKSGLRAV